MLLVTYTGCQVEADYNFTRVGSTAEMAAIGSVQLLRYQLDEVRERPEMREIGI
jgi:hypothetical protein